MTRGSTASIEVILEDVSSSDINKLYMTVRQKTLVLTKVSSSEGEDVLYWNEEDGLHVEIELTQEETLQFRYGVAEVQVRGVRNDGSIFASEICTIDVNRVLFDKIIEEGSSDDKDSYYTVYEGTVIPSFWSRYYGALLLTDLHESPIIEGTTYKVTVNGTEYNVVCAIDYGIANGNLALIDDDFTIYFNGEDTLYGAFPDDTERTILIAGPLTN